MESRLFKKPLSRIENHADFADVEYLLDSLRGKKNEFLSFVKQSVSSHALANNEYVVCEDEKDNFYSTASLELEKYRVLFDLLNKLDEAVNAFKRKYFISDEKEKRGYLRLVTKLLLITSSTLQKHGKILMLPRNDNKKNARAAWKLGVASGVVVTPFLVPITLPALLAVGLSASVAGACVEMVTGFDDNTPASALYTYELLKLLLQIENDVKEALNEGRYEMSVS